MSILSVFVDESGDFGQYNYHSPYYIFTLVFHEQAEDISEDIKRLENSIANFDAKEKAIHTGPLIRRESDYLYQEVNVRQQIFNRFFNFARTLNFTYKTIVVEKRLMEDSEKLRETLLKRLSQFISGNLNLFSEYSQIVVYYDNGQMELTKILESVFDVGTDFRKIYHSDYRMAQVADLICTLELLALKIENKQLSKSEIAFFESEKKLKKNYIKAIRRKRV